MTPDADDQRRDEAQEIVGSTAATFEGTESVSTKVLEGGDVVEMIVEQSASYDLTIVGATREGLLQQFVFGALPEQIGWRAQNIVIMAKRNIGIASRLSRWVGGWSG